MKRTLEMLMLYSCKNTIRITMLFLAGVFALLLVSHLCLNHFLLPKLVLENYSEAGIDTEEHFTHEYPTYKQVEEYLNNTTIIITSEYQNEVISVDQNHRFVLWYADQYVSGYWTSETRLRHVIFHGRSRWTVEQVFCQWNDDPDARNVDNCIEVYDLGSLFQRSRARQKVDDDPLELRSTLSPRFRLPEGPISLDLRANLKGPNDVIGRHHND